MEEMQLSVLIVSHGHTDCLPRCLRSLGNVLSQVKAEILLLDNLGGDLTKLVPPLPCPVRLFSNKKPAGYASNANQLTREAAAPLVLLLNPDTSYAEGRLDELLEWMSRHQETGLVGCRLLNEDGSLQASFRRFPSLLIFLLRGIGIDSWSWKPAFYRQRMMEGTVFEKPEVVDWMFGAFLLYRKNQYLSMGGMDEAFHMYYEDVDLARRYLSAGLTSVYYPLLSFFHIHLRSSACQPLGQTWRWHVRSAFRYFMKSGCFYRRGLR